MIDVSLVPEMRERIKELETENDELKNKIANLEGSLSMVKVEVMNLLHEFVCFRFDSIFRGL